MMQHKCYSSIVRHVIKTKKLKEPFNARMWRDADGSLAESTYHTFLAKHAKGNPGKNTELLQRVSSGSYILIRPIKYNVDC
jgi:hypothetical protein